MGYLTRSIDPVSTPQFAKNDVFDLENVVMRTNFKSIVFPKISDTIAEGSMRVQSSHILNRTTDTRNIMEIGGEKIFTPDEWMRMLYFGIIMRGKCFDTDPNVQNLSYINLEGSIFAVYAVSIDYVWYIGANQIDDKERDGANRLLISKE